MKLFYGGFALLFFSLATFGVGKANERTDRVEALIKTLRSHPRYKVRVAAALSLSKYKDPLNVRVIAALLAALRRRGEHPIVKGICLSTLARMRVVDAIPHIRRLSYSRNRFLRRKARQARRILCPRSLRGKRYYVSLEKIEAAGPYQHRVRLLVTQIFARYLAQKRRDVTLSWPRCRRPRRWMLRRRRIWGYYVRVKLKVWYSGGKTRCSMNILFTSYPKDSIKGMMGGSEASIPIEPGWPVVERLARALAENLKSSLSQFLR